MTSIIISISAATALIVLAGFFLYRDQSRSGGYLCAALVVTALLELLDIKALTAATDPFLWKRFAVITESLLPALWILSSLTFARQAGPWKIGRLLQSLLAVTFLTVLLPILLPLDNFLYAPDFPGESIVFLQNVGYFYYLWIMTCLVFALVHLEKTFANASPTAQFQIKYDIIALGTILAVLIFYYSQALLYRTLNMNYLPVRSIIYLMATAVAVYSLLCRHSKVRIEVSRQAAFKSVVLIAVGVYLLLIGLLGEGMQHFGYSFPRTITVSFAFLLGIALLLLLMSGRVRREVKVVLHKNFYQNKYDYRTQWLNFTMQLSTSHSSEELIQRILSVYCDVFGMEGASLFLYEESCSGYSMAAGYQMEPIEDVILSGNSLISFMQESAWVVCIKDDNPEIMAENERLFTENQVSFVVPLCNGELIEGFIMLGRIIKEDEIYIYEDYDLMKTIARQASQAILHEKLSKQITQAREITAIGNVATFVAHDLKNQVSNLSLIVENAARHISNPAFQQDMLASLGNTVEKMQKLIARLKNLGEKELFTPQLVNLLGLVENTATLFAGNKIIVSGTAQMVNVEAEEIQKVVMNLLVNAVEASAPDQQVLIEVGAAAGMPFVRVTDSGCGMKASFIRTELFKPFRTSKKQGLGIGLYQCRKILDAHGCKIDVTSLPGSGSVFTVWFSSCLQGEICGKHTDS